ncbi:hypothetical protein LCGC14_2150710 [marine sediment metagenome]|uniref:Sulfotransferase domain-containing protein n=1 Tax=marine sediment metagenome TaxID=412755 RepID=A0A0F9G8N4_9ZZZZ
MDIAFHIGAHCTDEDRLLKSLLRNREDLLALGISVPGPGKYRGVLRDVVTKLRGGQASSQTQDAVLETVLEGDDPSRLVLSNQSFISMPSMSVGDGMLYPKAFKAAWLRNIFPDHRVEFLVGLRNPATFLPALWRLSGSDRTEFATFLGNSDPLELRWSHMLARLREACPDAPIKVWCNEDTPLIWEEVLRAVTAAPDGTRIIGGFDILRTIMTSEGMNRLRAYTKAHPPEDAETRRRIVSAFLAKFALEDEIEEEFDLPGWTPALVDTISTRYDEDIEIISAMPGVTVIG